MSFPVSIYHPTDRPNFTNVDVGPVELWFSYRTVVAFSAPGIGRVVSENVWSKTTGKHLNHIDDRKDRRVRHAVFEARLAEVMGVLAAGLGEHDFAPLSPDDYASAPRRSRPEPTRVPGTAAYDPPLAVDNRPLEDREYLEPGAVNTTVGTTYPMVEDADGHSAHRNTGGPPLAVEVDDLTPDITARLAAIDAELDQGDDHR